MKFEHFSDDHYFPEEFIDSPGMGRDHRPCKRGFKKLLTTSKKLKVICEIAVKQKLYVVQQKHSKILDKYGKEVLGNKSEAYIPLKDFKYKK